LLCVGKHYLLLSTLEDGLKEVRTLMDELYLPLVPLFTSDPAAVKQTETAAMSASPAPGVPATPSTEVLGLELPVNVHLLSLEARSNSELLVRLAHQFAVNEDATLSDPVSVDLFQLLAAWGPVSAQEMTLSANQLKSEQLAGKIQWPTETGASAAGGAKIVKPEAVDKRASKLRGASTAFEVTLNPMQIKTFLVQLK